MDRFDNPEQLNEQEAFTNEPEPEENVLSDAESFSDGAQEETDAAPQEAKGEALAEEEQTEDGKEEPEEKKPEKKDSPALFFFDLISLVAASLAFVMLLLTFTVRQSPVLGSSMYPTIRGRDESGRVSETAGEDILLISRLFYTPKPGDIVVIQTPTIYSGRAKDSMNHSLVKRVIATGGDELRIDFSSWRIEVNEEVFEEGFGSAPYVNYPANSSVRMDMGALTSNEELRSCIVSQDGDVYVLKIPEGKLFVMGDNRNNSTDSRRIGLIDERWVAGKALLRVYPFDRFGSIY